MFDNRQLAAISLIAAFVVFVAATSVGRKAAAPVFRSFWKLKVVAPFFFYLAWLVGVHWLAAAVGLWNEKLLGDSIFWVGVTGIALIPRAITPRKSSRLFLPIVQDLLKLTVFFVFFLGIKLMNLGLEVAFQVVITLLLMVRTVAAASAEQRQVRRLCDSLILAAILGLTVFTVISLIHDWRRVDWWHEGRKFALPFWLTLGAIPYLYVIGLVSRYETMFALSGLSAQSGRTPVSVKIGVVLALRGRLGEIHDFRRFVYLLNASRSIRDGIAAVRDFRKLEADEVARKKDAQRRLEENAGSIGVDENGRQLDQREFAETKAALEWLSTCQMGWYQRQGVRYRQDLLDKLGDSFEGRGLPSDHGIAMVVSDDGQSWYAYRRTPSNWVLGIGAQDAPPDQWFYEGEAPPVSFPSPTAGWGEAAHAQGVNWRSARR